ncbi:MAG: hypothetical protein KDC95_00440 [Planctomycetes bacterium]|nr:hypothetical protein [Planctomycetota bacterium]
MICDIVVRSYWRDLEWLDYCLRSIERYCHGFREILVVLPAKSMPWFERHTALQQHGRRRGGTIGQYRLIVGPDYPDDYLGQQVTKLYADEISDAEYLCHVDSDCIFRVPTTVEDLVPIGKPKIYTRPLDELPEPWPWFGPTCDFVGEAPTHDFMQCPPFTYPAWLYRELRAWCRATHGVELASWVLSRPSRGFSEFNALGAYAYAHHRDRFVWVRSRDIGEEERRCHWHWSWGGIDDAMRRDLERLVASQEAHDG